MSNVFIDAMRMEISQLPPDPGAWSDVLARIQSWIGTCPEPEALFHLLQSMPPDALLLLYKRLFETMEGNTPLLDALVSFVLNSPGRHSDDEAQTQTTQELASSILLSAAACQDQHVRELSLCLGTEELVQTVFRLRALAATCHPTENAREQTRFNIWSRHYDSLVMALTVRATSAAHEYQRLVAGNSELANLLMSKRIKASTSTQSKALLTEELLSSIQQFNWHDRSFSELIHEHFLQQGLSMAIDAFCPLFARYASWLNDHNPDELLHLLERFYDNNLHLDRLLRLIADCDNSDRTLTINFITKSRALSPELIERLFERLDSQQLIALCGHVLALRQILRRESASLETEYCGVLSRKIQAAPQPEALMAAWADSISLLPREAQDEQIHTAFLCFDGHRNLQTAWIQALMSACEDNSRLLTYCQILLDTAAPASKTKLLKSLDKTLLLQLYGMQGHYSAAFIDLFKDSSTRETLCYLLCHTACHNPEQHRQLLQLVDENDLLIITSQLADRAKDDPAYAGSLEQTLIYLSQLLLKHGFEPEHPVHRWIELPSQQGIADRMLGTPECFANLSTRSTFMGKWVMNPLQGVLTSGPQLDFMLRITCVIDRATVDEHSIQNTARRLLSHYRQRPRELQTLFVNLYDARPFFRDSGKDYYRNLLQNCWNLLNPPGAAYEEDACRKLLTSQLNKAHRFDYLLTHLLGNVRESGDTTQSAHYLTQIEPEAIAAIDDPILANILLDSEQDNTQSNWSKAAVYLHTCAGDRSLSFLHELLEQTRKRQNPPSLCDRTRQLILDQDRTHNLIPAMSCPDLIWLVEHCPPDHLTTLFPLWLDRLLEQNRLDDSSILRLLTSLPSDAVLLNRLYQRETLRPRRHGLFMTLMQQDPLPEGGEHHLIALINQVSHETDDAKRQFLTQAQRIIQTQTMIMAPSLNMLLLSLGNQAASDADNQALVISHLQFIEDIADDRHLDASQRAAVHHLLEQLVLNTFLSLSQHDAAWAPCLLNNATFARSVLFWLAELPEDRLASHPFTTILLDNIQTPVHPHLLNSRACQRFIYGLLSAPPASMDEVQFQLMFARLNPDSQHQLALSILQRPSFGDVQWFSLITLSRALSVDSLYQLFETSKTQFIFIDLLFRHPQGIEQLTGEQKDTVLHRLTSASQVLRILDSQSPTPIKTAFVHALFQFLEHSGQSLVAWMNRVNVDSQTLAALANYTISPRDQRAFQEAIDSQSWCQQGLQDYLQMPSLDMPIQDRGFLCNRLYHTWLHPEQGRHCHPDLFVTLDPDSAQQAVLAHFTHLQAIDQLSAFYEPLNGCEHSAEEHLLAARWIQHLPLLADALFAILLEYRNGEDEALRQAIEQTNLYRELLSPMLLGHGQTVKRIAPVLLDQGMALLDDYLSSLPDARSAHHQRIEKARTRFLQACKTQESVASQPLRHLFAVDPQTSQPDKPRLDDSHIPVLANALAHHRERLQAEQLNPGQRLQDLLSLMASHPRTTGNESWHDWIVQHVLPSPLSADWHGRELYQVISLLPLQRLTQKLELLALLLQKSAQKNAQKIIPLKLLQSLSDTPLPALIDRLMHLDQETLTQCLEISRLLQLPCLQALLSLAQQASQSCISVDVVLRACLDPAHGRNLEMDWLRNELVMLEPRQITGLNRCKEAMTESLLYRNDDNDGERLVRMLRHKSLCDLPTCLNSYQTVFLQNKPALIGQYLKTLSQLLTIPELGSSLPKQLNPDLLTGIMTCALQNPEEHEGLLRHFLLMDRNKYYRNMLENHIQQRLSTLPTAPRTLALLTRKDLSALAEQDIGPLLVLQRLLNFFNPIDELKEWRNHARDIPEKSRAFLCADASVFHILNQLKRSRDDEGSDPALKDYIERMLGSILQYFRDKSHILTYYDAGQALNAQQPAAWYHYVCLVAFISNNYEALLNTFLSRLSGLPASELKNQIWLERWLRVILEEQLLDTLCQKLEKQALTQDDQADWLFTTSLRLQPDNTGLIREISLACTWTWLMQRIQSNEDHRLAWLQAALQCETHCRSILWDEASRSEFLALLNHCHLPPNDLIRLHEQNIHPALKTLLLTHVLSREDYLVSLNSENVSLLQQLDNAAKPRLRSLVQRIDMAQLPPAALSCCLPEAAASLLCSVKQFTLLNEERMLPLLSRLEAQHDDFVCWWIRQFSAMPGSDTPLEVLVKHHPDLILTTLIAELPARNKRLIHLLIANSQYLSFAALDDLARHCDEEDLQYAIIRFWHGHQQDEALITLLHTMIKSVLERTDDLTLDTTRLLIRLEDIPAFSTAQDLIGKATGDYLKHHAMNGNCSIFYENAQINPHRVTRRVSLKQESTGSNPLMSGLLQKAGAMLSYLLPKIPLVNLMPRQDTDEDLLEPAATRTQPSYMQSISSFNYFLIHFEGKSQALSDCLHDYFQSFGSLHDERQLPEDLVLSAWLLNQGDLAEEKRELMFNELLRQPNVLKGQVAAEALQYDARRLLRHFGQTKQYAQLQTIALSALNQDESHDSKHTAILSDAAKNRAWRAIHEARFEQELQNISGLFVRLRIWFRRCRFYGWSGFFRPDPPQFVAPFNSEPAAQPQPGSSIPLQVLRRPTAVNTPDISNAPAVSAPLSIWTDWHQVLRVFDSQEHGRDEEYRLRPRLDDLFNRLLQHASSLGQEHEFSVWLRTHSDEFINNRRRLLDLYRQDGRDEAFHALLTLACRGRGDFDDFATALNESTEITLMPEDLPKPQAKGLTARLATELNNNVKQTINTLGTISHEKARMFWTVRPTTQFSLTAQPASSSNWFGFG
ncbi:hypothetical protein [Legionella sp. CNM-4043-24]|uniref:hypothetical protein n=1 Tax=Legionella sp. CNM-4043-24 TaxID=3421646 RepID=UPI00403AC39E